jgi:protein-tyrosine-phosphatase
MADKLTNILFICKFNRFRSQAAESYFNQINKNPNYTASSAGFILPLGLTLMENQVKVAKEQGVDMKGIPKSLTAKMLQDSDIYVIVADDIPRKMLNAKKYNKTMYVWKIPDAHHDDNQAIANSVNRIKKKIEQLLKKLK